jgi:F-type H+-transporting ATPase subunit epsilon
MPFRLEVVTAERVVLSDEVDQVNVPGASGRMGILAGHEPLLTSLIPGEMDIIKGSERSEFAVSGGFMEVLPDRVTILADTAERADEIDEARAEAARQRAELLLAEAQLRRAMIRLQVARLKRGGRRGPGE